MLPKYLVGVLLLLLPSCYIFKGESMVIPKITSIESVQKQFPTTPDAINAHLLAAKKRAEADLEKLYAIEPKQRNFANTVKAFDDISARFSVASTPLSILEMVSPDKEIRDAAHAAVLDLSNFLVDYFTQNVKIYEAFKDYADNNDISILNSEERYTIEQLFIDFKHLGLHLPQETQDTLRELKKKLNIRELNFNKNVAQANRAIRVTKEDLGGLDEDFIETLTKTNDEKYIVGVDYPTYTQVIENCSVEATRKALWLEFVNRAYPENIDELNEVIKLRDEMAHLLGFSSYAALDIDGQTAHDPQTVEKFIADLIARAKIKGAQEFREMTKDLPESVTLTKENKIKPWDLFYLKNAYKKHLQVDELKIAEYFPLDTTIKALFDIYQTFFGLKFESVSIPNLWHPDVQALAVYKDKKFIGYILLDLFPRDNKYSHACEITSSPTIEQGGDFYPALILVIANFPKPTKDKPALLKRDDVITFFHEFGHAIHAILGATEFACNSGASVKRDFVELPSQMLEEWMWQPEILKQVSKHYLTGEPLPDDLIAKILPLKNYNSGEQTLKQLFYASTSLELFKPGADKNVHEIIKQLHEQITPNVAYDNESHFYASFGHLMGYGAKYYGYLWSKVYALDLFDVIKQHNFSPEIGQKYSDCVLSKGGSDDPMRLLYNFLGREPKSDAFFKDLGI